MSDLLEAIAAGQIASVYYLCGNVYLRERVAAALRRAVVGDDVSGFNYDALQGDEAGARGILAAVRTLPMLGGQRLVQVRDAHKLGADELKKLLPYVSDPSPHSVLVMLADDADLRLKFFTTLKKKGIVQKFVPLKEYQVAQWVSQEAKLAGVRLGPGAAQSIGDAVGTDMSQLADAVERLSLYVGPQQPIMVADVEEVLAQTRQRSIFELTNAVGRGERREAMLVLRRMIQSREPALRIVAMLARHLRQLWSVKELMATGKSGKAIASELGIHPYFINDMQKQAGRFDLGKLRQTHHALTNLDRALKSSKLPESALLDQLVLRLT